MTSPHPENAEAARSQGLTLSEGLTHYRWIVDQSHRYWAYFQIVGLGSSGFVWSSTKLPHDRWLFGSLIFVFLVFAFVSNRAIVGAQREAIAALDALKEALPEESDAKGDLNRMIRKMSHSSVRKMACWNFAMVVVTLAAIVYRYCTLSAGYV